MRQCAGYRVTIERLNPKTGRAETATFGCRSRTRDNALKRSGFLRVLKAEQLSAEQYEKEFPPGRISPRHVLVARPKA